MVVPQTQGHTNKNELGNTHHLSGEARGVWRCTQLQMGTQTYMAPTSGAAIPTLLSVFLTCTRHPVISPMTIVEVGKRRETRRNCQCNTTLAPFLSRALGLDLALRSVSLALARTSLYVSICLSWFCFGRTDLHSGSGGEAELAAPIGRQESVGDRNGISDAPAEHVLSRIPSLRG